MTLIGLWCAFLVGALVGAWSQIDDFPMQPFLQGALVLATALTVVALVVAGLLAIVGAGW